MGKIKKHEKPNKFKEFFRKVKEWWLGLTKPKKAIIISGVSLLVIFSIVIFTIYGYVDKQVTIMHKETPENYDLSLVDVDGYINILLLGVDSRNMENIKGTRSDMIMIASINKDTNDVKLTSIYRDTFTKIGETSTYDKITHACVYGGPEMTMKTVNQALDLNISNYAIVNFKVVADIVDAVGGITVNVEPREINQLNKYTIRTAKNIGKTNYKLVQSAGEQVLEGVQAVSYGRIRKGVGDDFKRTERMRIVVNKVFEKAKTMKFTELKKIVDIIVPQVQTNLNMSDILALGFRLPNYNITTGSGFPYKVTTGYINGVSYVFPVNLAENVIQLHKDVFGQENYYPTDMVRGISNEIIARINAAREKNEIENEKEVETVPDEGELPKNPDDEDISGEEGIEQDPSLDPTIDPNNPVVDPTDPNAQADPNAPSIDPNPANPTIPDDPDEVGPDISIDPSKGTPQVVQ